MVTRIIGYQEALRAQKKGRVLSLMSENLLSSETGIFPTL